MYHVTETQTRLARSTKFFYEVHADLVDEMKSAVIGADGFIGLMSNLSEDELTITSNVDFIDETAYDTMVASISQDLKTRFKVSRLEHNADSGIKIETVTTTTV